MVAEKYSRPQAVYVQELFSQIAWRYDLINNIVSWGQINTWRKKLVDFAYLPSTGLVLDLCAGTGEVTALIARAMEGGQVVALDFSPEMLERARKKLLPYHPRIQFCLGDAMALDFPDNTFDSVLTAFALRNVEDIRQVLEEMRRVTRVGGRVLSLDLGRPRLPVYRQLYALYFNHVLPFIGNTIQGQGTAYTYLRNSLAHFPHPEALKDLFCEVGLRNVAYDDLTGGIVTVHKGEK